MSILGTRVLRTEDPKFLTTGGVYTEDVVDDRLAGACHVFFVRSPLAHAQITSIDVSAALEAPGVVAAFTGADLADLPVIPPAAGLMNAEMTQRLLATDKVRFVGEPVAVVVTEQPYQGEDAIELVSVDYDPLPAVLGFEPGRRHACCSRRRAPTWPARGATRPSCKPDLFDGCEVVVSHTIINQRVAPGADGDPRRRGGLGRGRPADRLDTEPGRPGHPGTRWSPAARPGARPGPGHHAGRRRRVRRQVRRRPRARRWSPGWPASSAARPGGPRPGTRT